MERWKWIPGYRGVYKASNLGRIFSCWIGRCLKPHKDRDGYLQVILQHCRKKRRFFVHRLIWLTFGGPLIEGFEVNHLNGVKHYNAIRNLDLCTASENVQHAYDTGLHEGQLGSNNGMARFEESEVLFIVDRIKVGIPQKNLAEFFEVARSTICMINKGRNWAFLTA